MEENEKLEQNEQVKEINVMNDIKELVENELEQLVKAGIQSNNIDNFGKLVDIHKDIENECYWKDKREVMKMRYNDYDENRYGADRMYGPDEYGREDYGNYGKRGVPGTGRGRRYRGSYGHGNESEEMIERMREHFGNYEYSKEELGRGNYGAKGDTIKNLDGMLSAMMRFMQSLEEDADSQEEVQLIKKYARKMSEM